MKKYEFTNESIVVDGHTLHRIRALRPIEEYDVKIGDLGGFIESEENLSHDGTAWVGGDARVYGGAHVYMDALVTDSAEVYRNAYVYEDALVDGASQVGNYAQVHGFAVISDEAEVINSAHIEGFAHICGHALVQGSGSHIYGNACIRGDARIDCSKDVLWVSSIGDDDGTITAYRTRAGIEICGEGFCDTLAEFEQHKDKERNLLAQLIKLRFSE